MCASPLYWKSHGVPGHPAGLACHDALVNSDLGPLAEWNFNDDAGPFGVAVQDRLGASEAGPSIQAALHAGRGAGVVHLPAVPVRPYIDSSRPMEVLEDSGRSDLWLVAVYPQHRHRTAAERAFLQCLNGGRQSFVTTNG